MSTFNKIDRSLVAIFDIEAFSEKNPEKQAVLVQSFLEQLSCHFVKLKDLKPEAFSTGDGAIVSIGRNCTVDQESTKRFLSFAIEYASTLCKSGILVRTALNYSEGDRIVYGSEQALSGQYIQVGDTINIATRALQFCEPREIILTAPVQKLLRNHDLENEFTLHHNEPLVTKHGFKLDTYTYKPTGELKDILYHPESPLHPYKRFVAFPPIKTETLRCFLSNGLDAELRKVVATAYDAMRHIDETKTFVSQSDVMQVLTRPNYDPNDIVYVVSRNDRPSGFWTQKRRSQYISFLSGNARRHGGHINQTRAWVYDDSRPDAGMPLESIYDEIIALHDTKTLFNFPASLLYRYDLLSQLIFGCTISKKHKYAIIPVPGSDSIDATKLRKEYLGELLDMYRNYDASDGPMKAIISADDSFVSALIAEFENLMKDAAAVTLK